MLAVFEYWSWSWHHQSSWWVLRRRRLEALAVVGPEWQLMSLSQWLEVHASHFLQGLAAGAAPMADDPPQTGSPPAQASHPTPAARLRSTLSCSAVLMTPSRPAQMIRTARLPTCSRQRLSYSNTHVCCAPGGNNTIHAIQGPTNDVEGWNDLAELCPCK